MGEQGTFGRPRTVTTGCQKVILGTISYVVDPAFPHAGSCRARSCHARLRQVTLGLKPDHSPLAARQAGVRTARYIRVSRRAFQGVW